MSSVDVMADKEQLRHILQRDEYTEYLEQRSNPVLDWLERMWRRLLDLFPDVPMPDEAPLVLTYVLVGVVALMLLGVIVWLVRSVVIARRQSRKGVFRSTGELDRSAAVHRQEAERLAAEGDYEEAVRRLFLALLLLLHERRWVQAEKWKTNDEYMEELGERQPRAAAPFRCAASLYEQVYYGGVEADASHYEAMVSLLAPFEGKEAVHAEAE
ncbi:DUF4129 domain-containing protein [Paenibacillus sp. YYML68]|uniref:DUF4129 domain-containing protein n=1 Tax=Paenibacillus sp. YYML68 TaxID=2909250 RepID=UPI0024921F44|nr:DUF4129 domain-containing protein [Paenibacillus sp. YYML68]